MSESKSKKYFYVGEHQDGQVLKFENLTEIEKSDALLDLQVQRGTTETKKFRWEFMFKSLDKCRDHDFERMNGIEDDENAMDHVEQLMEKIKKKGLRNAVVGTEGNHRKVAYDHLKIKKIPYLAVITK